MAQTQKKEEIKMTMEEAVKPPIGESDVVEPWERQTQEQAYHEAEKKHLKPGEAGRWCNPKLREKNGWEGWQAGENSPKVGDEVLATMPIEKEAQRTAYYANQSKTQKYIRQENQRAAMEELNKIRSNSKSFAVSAQIS